MKESNESAAKRAKRLYKSLEKMSNQAKVGVDKAIKLGKILDSVKKEMPHDDFTGWVQEECGFSVQKARDYIKTAKVAELTNASLYIKGGFKDLVPAELAHSAVVEGVEMEDGFPDEETMRAETADLLENLIASTLEIHKKIPELFAKMTFADTERLRDFFQAAWHTIEIIKDNLPGEEKTLDE